MVVNSLFDLVEFIASLGIGNVYTTECATDRHRDDREVLLVDSHKILSRLKGSHSIQCYDGPTKTKTVDTRDPNLESVILGAIIKFHGDRVLEESRRARFSSERNGDYRSI